MSTLLEHPQAQALLEQTELDPKELRASTRRLTTFLQRYLPCFYRQEQRQHADTILRGKLTALQRKTTEPIARQAGQKRRPLQHFLGAGLWNDQSVLHELQRDVQRQIADDDGVLILDGHGTPKKGTESCGVARPWCGKLGKVDNCQVGVFLAYASRRGRVVVDAQLYLPKERADDAPHRQKTYVPKDITFQEKPKIGVALVQRVAGRLRHGWVVGDDEFGRCVDLRRQLRYLEERYVVDVPCDTHIRALGGRGGKRESFERVDVWAARQAKKRWKKIKIRDGEKGPVEVEVLSQMVQAKEEEGRVGVSERLVVMRSLDGEGRTTYTLSHKTQELPVAAIVRARGSRRVVEQLFAEGNQEVGLDAYEVRSWSGWHHHMTLTMLALWFLQVEALRLKKKTPGITAPLIREIFSRLLARCLNSNEAIAEEVSEILHRTEESRIYHWHERTGSFPPPRGAASEADNSEPVNGYHTRDPDS